MGEMEINIHVENSHTIKPSMGKAALNKQQTLNINSLLSPSIILFSTWGPVYNFLCPRKMDLHNTVYFRWIW